MDENPLGPLKTQQILSEQTHEYRAIDDIKWGKILFWGN